MHDDILWQVYAQNGQALPQKGVTRAEFKKTTDLTIGAVHVWLWRVQDGNVEVLLQTEGDDQLSLREEPAFSALPRRTCAAPLSQR